MVRPELPNGILALALPAALGMALPSCPAMAQDGAPSRAVVQALPPAAAAELTEALRRIAADPADAEALLMAGRASLRLEDPDAAMGFFTRARDLDASSSGQAKAGMAAVLVYRKMPVEALRLFGEAEAQGASLLPHAADYALALDLVGDNPRAQTYYRLALQERPDDEVTRRLALSQAIGGDLAASEMTLLPLLQHQDLAAYRTRAFALAARGRTEEAVAIAEAIMPPSLASRIAPYLRYMPKLTRAQQAAAAIFGHFPEAAAIGRDDPRIAELSRAAGERPPVAGAADGRLVPAGEPLGPARQSAPSPPPAGGAVPWPASSAGEDRGEMPRPGFSVGRRESPIPDRGEGQGREASRLAEAFADFATPAAQGTSAPGAVDVTAIAPAREARPQPAREPKKPAHPSRIWVQVATGRDRAALAFDWRRIVRQGGAAMQGRSGYLVRWGQASRLVTGPFATRQQASGFVGVLKRSGIDSFVFTSDDGEAVEPLPRR